MSTYSNTHGPGDRVCDNPKAGEEKLGQTTLNRKFGKLFQSLFTLSDGQINMRSTVGMLGRMSVF